MNELLGCVLLGAVLSVLGCVFTYLIRKMCRKGGSSFTSVKDTAVATKPLVAVRWVSGHTTYEEIEYHDLLGAWVLVRPVNLTPYQLGPRGWVLSIFTGEHTDVRWVPWCNTPQEVVDMWNGTPKQGNQNGETE